MSNITPFNFENHSIRVVTDDNGEPWFSAKEVCDVLGFGNPHQALASHVDDDDLQKLEAIDSMGRKQMANHINESGLYALIFGSTKDEAKRFKRWVTHEVLPSIRKTGAYVPPKTRGSAAPTMSERQIRAARALISGYAEDLKISKASIAGAYLRLEEKAGFKGMLPHYVAEGPEAETRGSEATMSATELLKKNGISLSARAFNQMLHEAGILEEKTRPSSRGGQKRFWSITDFRYGKNETSPSNPRETQPLWYESKFDELLMLIIPTHGGDHAN